MSFSKVLFFLSCLGRGVYSGCPFSSERPSAGTEGIPNDPLHQNLRGPEEVAEVHKRQVDIISKARVRNLQQSQCITTSTYNNLLDDVGALGLAFGVNSGDRGHFFGGIVRLAAHDFMDYDLSSDVPGGTDGCIDFTHSINNGLDIVWCDNGCPLKDLYDSSYSFMTRADFWVAAGNAAIKATALNGFELPFRWGRTDRDDCPESGSRIPLDGGCDQVEGVFLNRMGLSWTDATALIGGHTLGRGTETNSEHDGIWVQSGEESAIFDKGFYDELIERAWRPLFRNGLQHDWTWGRPDRDVMMLNTDICLYFDISNPNCCTNIRQNCRDTFENTQCPESTNTETVNAIDDFRARGNNNDAFYDAFFVAWQKATENGHSELSDLDVGCLQTATPTVSPTKPNTREPTRTPTATPTNSPIKAATDQPSGSPTITPTNSPIKAATNRPSITPITTPTNSPIKAVTNKPSGSPTKTISTNWPTPTPIECPKNNSHFEVLIHTDSRGDDLKYSLKETTLTGEIIGHAILSVAKLPSNTQVIDEACISPTSCYMFKIVDNGGDGNCCSTQTGNTMYELLVDGEVKRTSLFSQGKEMTKIGKCYTPPTISPAPTTSTSPTKIPIASPVRSPTTEAPISSLCPPNKTHFKIIINTDKDGHEIKYVLNKKTKKGKWSKKKYLSDKNLPSNAIVEDEACISSKRCYRFKISDSAGNGLCCSVGNRQGRYTIYLNGELKKTSQFITKQNEKTLIGQACWS